MPHEIIRSASKKKMKDLFLGYFLSSHNSEVSNLKKSLRRSSNQKMIFLAIFEKSELKYVGVGDSKGH